MDMSNDHICIAKCLDGDREAFKDLVIRYQKHIFFTICRMINNHETARDLAQDVFLKAYTKLFSYDSRYPFKVWITRIATYHTIDYLRQRKRNHEISMHPVNDERPGILDTAQSNEPLPDENVSRREQSGLVAEALQNLDSNLRIVIVLRHYEDMSYSEIADVLNIPVGTVKNRLFRAREKLQELFLSNPVMLQEVV